MRVVIAGALAALVFRYQATDPHVMWNAVGCAGTALLGTWALAGHSSSMRWSIVGVISDVIHHTAAATWLVGLGVVAWLVRPHHDASALMPTMARFSRVAALSVGALVITGLIQSLRLVGSPTAIFTTSHGQLLTLKLLTVGAMLVLANMNRRRFHQASDVDSAGVRRAVAAELFIGLIVIGITASLVVSQPATSLANASIYYNL